MSETPVGLIDRARTIYRETIFADMSSYSRTGGAIQPLSTSPTGNFITENSKLVPPRRSQTCASVGWVCQIQTIRSCFTPSKVTVHHLNVCCAKLSIFPGRDLRELSSPSWFNIEETSAVWYYVRDLRCNPSMGFGGAHLLKSPWPGALTKFFSG